MLTKAQIKYIQSLTEHKTRIANKVFVAEGPKIVSEWLHSRSVVTMIVATKEWVNETPALIAKHPESSLYIVNESLLDSVSSLHTPNQVLIVVAIPEYAEPVLEMKWYLALDDIQDPGNMGTIIRIADWFGIEAIFCSHGCVDVYNPKVVQAAMGGHLRVKIFVKDLISFLSSAAIPKIAATLDGENIFRSKFINRGILIIGNESKGVSDKVLSMATKRVTIPRKGGAESLNAGISTGILCAFLTK